MRKSRLLTGFFLGLAVLLTGFSVKAQLTPDIVVALDGSGDYTKIQEAIDAAPANSERRTLILIKRGLYNTEKLIIPADKKNVTLIGESREETIISYHIYDCASSSTGKCPEADAALWSGDNIRTSATLTIMADGFRAENLTIRNTAGPVGQAQAITVRGDKTVFINCNLLGYQDTIYFWGAGKRSYFEGCLVAGRTDYIYGDGIAWFEACEIRSWGGGWITAPSTPETQAYGYIFNNCILTFATGSPRSGDDEKEVALGRPWHNYPKVLWMNTEMTEMIDPLGWPTTWNMEHAATSDKLELYEYNNTGPGADMSGRADWVGIRAITAEEAAEYTIANVFNGWDPTAEAPLVKTYTWTGSGAEPNWLLADNWYPAGDATSGVPLVGESATADGAVELIANGETFAADLSLTNGAKLNITANSTLTYLTVSGAEIYTAADVSLGGKIATKGASKFVVPGTLTLDANILGVHELSKEGAGKVVLTADNSDFSGNWLVTAGTLEANAANSLGKGSVEVSNGATLVVGNDNALQPTSKLMVATGSSLVLNATITLSEFFIDGQIQPQGEYTSTTHPNLISGSGKVIVGRPSQFTFIGGTNGNWDNPAHFSPALMPEAGETVIVEKEIETTGTVFAADIVVNSPGRIRLRGTHQATGEITLNAGSMLSYATGGTGFTLDAPITIAGDVRFEMSSGNEAGSAMNLPGNIKGDAKVTAHNSRDLGTTATVILGGDNSGFTGTWDLTTPPRHAAATTAIEGLSANAFGAGKIEVASRNRVIFSHEKAAGDALDLSIQGEGKAILNADVAVQSFTLNGAEMADGVYSAATHPDLFEGTGSITVSNPNLSNDANLQGITVNGEALSGFSANQLSYTFEYASPTTEAIVVATPADENATVSGVEDPIDLTGTEPVTATIVVTAEDGSTEKTYTIQFVALSVGLDNFLSGGVKVYPNPALEKLTLENAAKLVSVKIYSLQGTLLKTVKADNQAIITINVADLNSGFYLLKAVQNDRTVLSGKFVKK